MPNAEMLCNEQDQLFQSIGSHEESFGRTLQSLLVEAASRKTVHETSSQPDKSSAYDNSALQPEE